MKIDSIKNFLDEIEQKDAELIKHYERVAMLNLAFGRELSLKPSEQERLYFVGLFHEIGKFENSKYENIYPVFSAAILRTHKEFSKISNIVEQCEENIDGSGYPNKLSGDSIHLFATLTHLCDKYDHLVMKGLNRDEAVLEIRKLNDIICPKKLITVFVKMLFSNKELINIYKGDLDG